MVGDRSPAVLAMKEKEEQEENKRLTRHFDEQAYLAGKVSLFGDDPQHTDISTGVTVNPLVLHIQNPEVYSAHLDYT